MFKNWFNVAFGLCLLIAAVLRFWQLGQVPVSLYWDEAAMLVDVKSVVQTGHDMHGRPWYQVLYPSYGDYKLPVYIWSAELSAKIFGVSEWSLRLPSALAGIGTVIVAGLIARQLATQKKESEFGQRWQIATMAVVAISPWSLLFSRTAFEGHLGQFLLACSVLLLLLARKKPGLIIAAGLLGALATYSYFSVRFVWPVATTLMWFYSWWRSPQRFQKKTLIKFGGLWLAALVVFGVALLPMQRSPLYKDSNTFRLGTDSVLKNDAQVMESNVLQEQAGNTKWGRIFYHRYWLTARELASNYSDNLSLNFLFVKGDPNLRHGTGAFGLFVWPLLLAFLAGAYGLWRRDKVLLLTLLSWWLVALLPASVPQNTPHALRSLNALVPLSVMIGFGLEAIFSWAAWHAASLRRRRAGQAAVIFVVIYFVLLAVVTITFVIFYFAQYPRLSAQDWQDGYKQLAEKLVETKEPNQEVWVVPFDDRFYLWVMGYGPYTGKDFQSWKSVGYQFGSFDGYHFNQYSHDQVAKSTTPLLLAGRSTDVLNELQIIPRKPKEILSVTGFNPDDRFVIARFE